ncbi:MAG: HAD-IA family hydrolase [Gammaproteobacteria bacterium]
MPDKYSLVIFDWDGTLMDSEQQIVFSIQAAISDLGLEERSHFECKQIIGLGLKEALAALYPEADDALLKVFVERYRYYWFGESKESILFDGVVEMLEQLRSRNVLLAVATGKGRMGLDKVLQETQLREHFVATRCAEETRSKPHPKMLLEIFDELKVSPQQSLMVGDTEFDLHMANRAKVDAVAVNYGVHDEVRLNACKPLASYSSVRELSDWLSVNTTANTDYRINTKQDGLAHE